MEVVCVYVCEGVCLCSCQLAERVMVMEVAYCKKVHNCQMDSQTQIHRGQLINCSGQLAKGGGAVGVPNPPITKRPITSKQIHVT